MQARIATTAAAGLATGLWAAALLGFGAASDGYSQQAMPVALPGARGMPHAGAFNLAVYVLPGLLAAVVAASLRGRLPDPAPWAARIGSRMLLLSALAFAAQGVLPLDFTLDSPLAPAAADAGANRLHAAAWTLWWIAFVPGALALGVATSALPGWRATAAAAVAAAIALPLSALLLPALLPVGIAQRAASLCWFGWWLAAARAPLSRGAASTPGSSPPAPG